MEDESTPPASEKRRRLKKDLEPSGQIYVRDDSGEFIPVALEPLEDAGYGEPGLIMAAQQNFHAGPLPSVEMFKAYGEVVPTAPERILRMAEKEQDAAHEFSRTALGHEKTLVSQGQWMGFIAMMVALLGGIYLALQGEIIFACALVSPAVLTPIMRFYFRGKHEAQKGDPPPNEE
ncbi:MAG: DUF2335 domain-containing protein [Erythrobacter sp.]|nr:DUF2335 domain-containing protein [Erythrobacter sp.]MDZ4272066.1 DUF2335 domain-containing protein [Erythrobacter sp.]MDZ4276548.1 DUF2335 domain-containing protein [Erythrobacter sp.]